MKIKTYTCVTLPGTKRNNHFFTLKPILIMKKIFPPPFIFSFSFIKLWLITSGFFGLTASIFGQLGITITPDNSNPTIGCQSDNVVKYTVEVCNKSLTTGFDYVLTINSPLDRQIVTEFDPSLQLTQINPSLEQLTGSFYIFPGNCDYYTFSAEVFDFGAGGTFTVSATTVVSPSGATANAQTIISSLPEIVISGTQTISSLVPGTLPANGCDDVQRKIRLTANAVLEVDQDYCFSNTKFIVESGGSIVVQSGAISPSNLQIYNCKLFGCGTMWRGITVQESNAVFMWKSFISDAQYGIQSRNASSIGCIGNTFDRNFVGFHVPDLNGSMQFTQVTMLGNLYTCSDDLSAAFAGQSPAPGSRSYAGIEANRLLTLTVASWGYVESFFYARFSKMRNGIIMNNCNSLYADRCVFEDLKEVDGNDGYPMSGRGIHFRTGELLSVKGWGGEPGLTASFSNCDYAVEAEVASVSIEENAMYATQFGVSLQNCFSSLKIRNNYIESAWRGITSFECRPLTGEIADNFFYIGGTPATGFGAPTVAAAMGIYDYNNLAPQIYWDIHDNEITLDAAWVGMDIAFTRNARVHHNTIWMLNDEWNKVGIQLGGAANQNQIYRNDIHGIFSNSICEPTTGIAVVNSYADTIYCNDNYDTNYGIQFRYGCSSTDLRGNRLLNANDIGLMLGAEPVQPGCFAISVTNTVIGQQFYRGNSWDGNYNLNGAKNTATSFLLVLASRFDVYQFNPPPPLYLPPNISSVAPWFFNQPPPIGTKTYLCPPEPPEEYPQELPTALDYAIADSSLGTGAFVNTFRWILKRQLLHRLDEHPGWLNTDAAMQTFYNNPQNASARAFHEFSRQVGALGSLGENDINYINQLQAEMSALLDDYTGALANLYSGTLDEQDSLTVEGQVLSLHQQLLTKTGQLRTFWDDYRADRAAAAAALLSQVENLSDTAVYENNEKSVLKVALQLALSGAQQLSPVQREALEAVAEQCLYAGGDAVAAARNILNVYDRLRAYDDNELCDEDTPRPKERSTAAGFSVWPNPAQGVIQIESGYTMQKITLSDLNGKVWQEQAFDNVRETTLTLPNLSSGVYLLSIISSDGHTAIQKIIILH